MNEFLQTVFVDERALTGPNEFPPIMAITMPTGLSYCWALSRDVLVLHV